MSNTMYPYRKRFFPENKYLAIFQIFYLSLIITVVVLLFVWPMLLWIMSVLVFNKEKLYADFYNISSLGVGIFLGSFTAFTMLVFYWFKQKE